ncbi:hypothetical protein [Rhodovulum sp. PH10]|uniref:hypothetical protein n=1 Tax=Rhodovulum sp. PH10 TaxID=1187851 RepID=UPI00058FE845|nr:hypothetical protein [Rhodovulum sp. PH10]
MGQVSTTADLIFAIALLVMVGCNLWLGPRIRTATAPIQWGFDGHPTKFAPRTVAIWLGPTLAVAVRLLIGVLAELVPDSVHGTNEAVLMLAVVTAVAQVGHLLAVVRWARRQ